MSHTSLLRDWDQGSQSRRKELLTWFVRRFHDAHDDGELEAQCGPDVSLLLPRVLAWMHKLVQSVIDPKPPTAVLAIDDHLACLALFLAATTNASHYYREFLQADGLAILMQTLRLSNHFVNDTQRCAIYRLFLRMLQRGREFQALISEYDGERAFIDGALATMSSSSPESLSSAVLFTSPVWSLCRRTLLDQITGNRASITQTHSVIVLMLEHEHAFVQVFGAQILRELVTETSFFHDAYYRRCKARALIPLCMRLLQSTTDNLRLEHEALELVHSLVQTTVLQESVCAHLARWLHDSATAADLFDKAYASLTHTREYEMYIHLRAPFVHAAQAINTLMNSTPAILSILVETHEILIPIAFVLATSRPASLKWHAALTSLHFISTQSHVVAMRHLSELFDVSVHNLDALPRTVGAERLARCLLGDETHRQRVVAQFHSNGWRQDVSHMHLAHQRRHDDDEQLHAIEKDLESAVRDVLPSTLVDQAACSAHENTRPHHYDEHMDVSSEHHLRQQLEQHFARFRRPLNA